MPGARALILTANEAGHAACAPQTVLHMVESAPKPDGGFVFIPAMALIASWWAYKRGFIRFADLRVWYACHELLARRSGSVKGRVPRFSEDEVRVLVDAVGCGTVRSSLARLKAAGLLTWSATTIRFPRSLSDIVLPRKGDLEEAVSGVVNHRRKVPVPRRLLRHLAASGTASLVGTAIGHLLRCMYYRRGECRARGLCKASWIAETFELDERSVKRARALLVETGVLIKQPTPQHVLNRWGAAVVVNLQWAGVRRSGKGRMSPPRAVSTSKLPPPRRTGNSLPRSENQKPSVPVPPGVRMRTRRGPSLADVVPDDLNTPGRLELLRADAVRRGHLSSGEGDRLRFVAAAVHAHRVGTRNRCGLFAAIVRRQLWHVITQADEETARSRLGQGSRIVAPIGREARSSSQSEPLSAGSVLAGVLSGIGGADRSAPDRVPTMADSANACQSLAGMVRFQPWLIQPQSR